MRKAAVLMLLFLASALPAYSFQFSKVINGRLEGNNTFKIHVTVPPEYDAVWLKLEFASNKTCNASASYSVIQYHEVAKRGKVSIRWLSTPKQKHMGEFVIPLHSLRGEFDVYANVSVPCRSEPLRYLLHFSINLDRVRYLNVRTNQSIESAWILDIVKDPHPLISLNTSGKLLGMRLRLYNYRGEKVHGVIKWSGGRENFTVPERKGWLWIPGENASGKVELMLNVPSTTGIEARAYYISEVKPVNTDLLYKKNDLIIFYTSLERCNMGSGYDQDLVFRERKNFDF